MSQFKESPLHAALAAEDKVAETILAAIGSATTDLGLRNETGQTYIHLASRSCELIKSY